MKNRKISTFVTSINQNFAKLAGNRKKLEEIEYGTLYHSYMLETSRLYIARMINIDSNIIPPNKLDLTISLLSNNIYYILYIAISTLNSVYVHIICTLLKKDRTSLFHNELFKLNKVHLISVIHLYQILTIADLYFTKIDTLTKKIDKNLLLYEIIFPV